MGPHGRIRGRVFRWLAALAFTLLLATPGARAGDFITVASTTSTQNAGLFDHLLPLFEDESGIEVRVVAVGTGQALRLARNGDADLLLVHDKPSEEAFVAEGYGSARFDLMYKRLRRGGSRQRSGRDRGCGGRGRGAGPDCGGGGALRQPRRRQRHTPARAHTLGGRRAGTQRRVRHLVPRGRPRHGGDAQHGVDDGGLHARRPRDMALHAGQARPQAHGRGRCRGFATSTASPSSARRRHPHVKAALARQFADWLLSPAGQAAIDGFTIDGERLFIPNAN